MAKRRYYRSSKGYNAEVLVAKAVAYTANTTYAAFVADDGNEGQIGVFNAATGAAIDDNVALTEGTRFFIAQKRDGGTFKTTPILYDPNQIKKVAYVAPVKQISTIDFTGVVPAVDAETGAGSEIAIKIIETTPGHEPFPTWTYSVEAKPSETLVQALDRLVAKINDDADVNAKENGRIVSASRTNNVVTLTALYFGSSFRLATPGAAYPYATIATTTAVKIGSGYGEHVQDLENEGQIYEGVTTQYAIAGGTQGEWGAPTNFADPAGTYDIYQITPLNTEKSPTPVERHVHYHNVVVAVPTSGGPSLDVIFGFEEPAP